MPIYAVIKTGGKQYRVAPGDVVKVEKLGIVLGATVEISEVYLIADDHDITVGHPTIVNARVVAEVVEQGRDKKIITFKKKRRKGYQRTIGHRQYFTALRIREIALGDHVYKAQARISRPDALRTTARPARPLPTKADLPKPSAAKFVAAPKAPPPKETAPTQTQTPADRAPVAVPDVRGQDAVAEPARAQPPSTTSEPVMAAPETTSPTAPPASRMATTEFETAKPPPMRETEPPHTHTPAPQPQTDQTHAYNKRRYWLIAVVVALLLGTAWVLFRDLGRRAPQDAVPAAAQPKEAPPPKAKKSVQEVKIKKPTAGAAPSAPVQPPD